jgi:hypothetical protein
VEVHLGVALEKAREEEAVEVGGLAVGGVAREGEGVGTGRSVVRARGERSNDAKKQRSNDEERENSWSRLAARTD